jgi:murein DD-endopeptidase MepM/ murein hydrolase activator NlpD
MPLRQGETVPQMITRVAREQGLDARGTRIALAIVAQESGFNPQAEGDWSDSKKRMRSIGLFQLNEEGLGSGMGDTRYDPEANANRGIANLKAVLAKHGGQSDGQVAYLAQRPADQGAYVASINAKTNGNDPKWAGTIQNAMRGLGDGAAQASFQANNSTPVFPIAGQNAGNTRVTTEFGAAGANTGYEGVPQSHRGTDYSANKGAQVVAPVSGTVTMAHAWDGTKNDPYGNWIEVKGDDGKNYRFAHLQTMDVKAGSKVGQGQQLGRVDSTGNSTGDHLHVEVLDSARGNQPINPKEYLATGTSVGSPVGGFNMAEATAQANAVVSQLEEQVSTIRAEAAKSSSAATGLQAEKDRNDAERTEIKNKKNKTQADTQRDATLKARNTQIDIALPAAQEKATEDNKLLRATELQLAQARQQASGKELDSSQREQNEAAAASARAQAAKLENDVQQSRDPASPENQGKLAQAALWRKQADNYDSIVKADNSLKAAQAQSAQGSANQANAQADYIRGTLDSVVANNFAQAGLNEQQAKALKAKLQPEIDRIIAETGKVKTDAEYTRALTKAVNEKLPQEIAKYRAEIGLTDAQANDLTAKLPGALVLQGTQARLDQAQAEAQRSSGIANLATAHKTQFDMQMEAWKAQRTQALTKMLSDPNVTSDDLGGFLMSAATNATEMVNAFNAEVGRRTAEESARGAKVRESIDIQNADESMRNNLANNITGLMNARANQQNASTQAVGPTLGAGRMANMLSGLGALTGSGGLDAIANRMGVGAGVLNGVKAGLQDYEGQIKDFRNRMPNVRMANPNIATPNFNPQLTAAGRNAAAGANAAVPAPPSAPSLNLPTSVPADQPAVVQPFSAPGATAATQDQHTPPEVMDDTGPEPQQPTEEQVEAQKEEEEEGAGGGGGMPRFEAPQPEKKKRKRRTDGPSIINGAAFRAPMGRAA